MLSTNGSLHHMLPCCMEIWLVSSYCLSVLVVLTNTAVLLVVHRNASLHRTTYAFICSLAACDLLYGLCFAFFASAAYFDRLGGNFTACRLALTCFYASIGCSTVGIALIAMERFVAIRYPIAYRRLVTCPAVGASIAMAILLVIGPVTAVVFATARRPPMYPSGVGCITQRMLPPWAIAGASGHIALTQTVATGCYLTVYRVARLQQLRAKHQLGQRARLVTRNWQVTASIGLLIFLFYFFWIPTWAYQLYRLGKEETTTSLTVAYYSSSFSSLNSIVNIFVYWLRTREFRLAVKRTLLGADRSPRASSVKDLRDRAGCHCQHQSGGGSGICSVSATVMENWDAGLVGTRL